MALAAAAAGGGGGGGVAARSDGARQREWRLCANRSSVTSLALGPSLLLLWVLLPLLLLLVIELFVAATRG